SSMFSGCENLEELDLSGCDTRNVMYMGTMFFNCGKLKTLKVNGKFSTESATEMYQMFYLCSSLEELDLSTFSTASLKEVNWYTVSLDQFLSFCSNLKIVKFGPNFKPSKSGVPRFFASCSKLQTIIVETDEWPETTATPSHYQMFNYCNELVGGNGTKWDDSNIDNFDYFRIDTDEHPGYLTKLPYSIQFVDVDEKGTKKVLSTSEYLPYDSEISFFANNPSEEFTPDVTIPTRDGYEFVGWSDSLNTGLSAFAKEVKINPATDRYNRIYKANWKKRITADIDGNISYPKDLPLYCDGKETTILLPFTITYGKATGFEIKFGDNQFSAKGEIKDKDTAIVVNVPETLTSGVYKGELVFTGTEDPNSDPYPITLTANIVQDAAVQLYTDVLIADNHDGFYNAFQWYKDGEPLAGANLQYYTEPKFDYTKSYSVELSGDGGKIMSCPVKWLSTAKVLNPSVKVYPNPAKQNELFTLEIIDFDETQNYDIVIFTANGTLVKKISNVEKQTSVSLPTGIYSGSLISGDDKKGFKLIVK
ncbi:MAG: BspA family leucine-rich repeat surface protein, partial [Bacteroidales bacterium]|nr:BspA family leucine-rich repeat surface protein [Bacteroidales bacterium]